jgi:hypothetical protein
MNIEELAVTLQMLGYNFKINKKKTVIYLFIKIKFNQEELKQLLQTLNFYYILEDNSGLFLICKDNIFKWN